MPFPLQNYRFLPVDFIIRARIPSQAVVVSTLMFFSFLPGRVSILDRPFQKYFVGITSLRPELSPAAGWSPMAFVVPG